MSASVVTFTSNASAVVHALPPQGSASALPPVVNGMRNTIVSIAVIFIVNRARRNIAELGRNTMIAVMRSHCWQLVAMSFLLLALTSALKLARASAASEDLEPTH